MVPIAPERPARINRIAGSVAPSSQDDDDIYRRNFLILSSVFFLFLFIYTYIYIYIYISSSEHWLSWRTNDGAETHSARNAINQCASVCVCVCVCEGLKLMMPISIHQTYFTKKLSLEIVNILQYRWKDPPDLNSVG